MERSFHVTSQLWGFYNINHRCAHDWVHGTLIDAFTLVSVFEGGYIYESFVDPAAWGHRCITYNDDILKEFWTLRPLPLRPLPLRPRLDTSALFGKDTSAPRQDPSAPREKTLRPLAKDTSAPCKRHFGPWFLTPTSSASVHHMDTITLF